MIRRFGSLQEDLRRIVTPRAAQVALLLVLVVTAVMLADADGGQQIADDAAVQRSAESVLSATAVTESSARELVLVARAWRTGVANDADIDETTEVFEERLRELDVRVDTLRLLADRQDLRSLNANLQRLGDSIVTNVASGEIERAAADNARLAETSRDLTVEAASIRNSTQSRIDATRQSLATVAAAARIVAGLGIPALVLLFLYRALRIRQQQVLIRNERDRERALAKKKDQFLASASHHLNTPLSAVVGYSELLSDRSRTFNAAQRNDMIEILAAQAKETSNVAEDLLIAARTDMEEITFETATVSLRQVIEETLDSLSSAEMIRLDIKGEGYVQGDPKRIRQIVRNLLRNALTHGGESVKVTIGQAFNRVLLEVTDDGEGIPEAEREKIFKPYYSIQQVEGIPPSLGLGLSVARRLARAMGGNLDYQRRDGLSIFSLALPRTKETPDRAEPEDLTIDPTAGQPTPEDITALLDDRGPLIVYQPIVEMNSPIGRDESIVGYESLARFPFASPPDWFKASRRTGMRIELELACARAAIDHFEHPDDSRFLAVNVSDDVLTSTKLLETIREIDAGRLVLELSETATIKNYKKTSERVQALARKGVRLAIDDVGAEEIDLWHIIRLGASIVKIDMSLIRDIDQSAHARGVIRAIVALADEIGALAIAEGVETETEHNHLIELGVRLGQGYLYGKPGPLKWSERVLSA